MDHFHLRVDRQAQRGSHHPPFGGGLGGCRGRDVFAASTSRPGATGSWRGCQWRSMLRARKCGSRGATGPAWCRPLGRWSVPVPIWGRGCANAGSRWFPPSQRWPRCGRPKPSRGIRLLIFGGQALPAELAGRLAGPSRRGLEHLRSNGIDGHRLRGGRRRQRPSHHWVASAGMGPGRRRHEGNPVLLGLRRRTNHRRCRTGSLPGCGKGRRRNTAAMPTLGWGPCLPQRGSGVCRPSGPALCGPRRRAGQAWRQGGSS